MTNVKYLILGGGPAGLTFAHMLKKRGENSFLLIEKENEAGGLCRSKFVDGAWFDIGGGHFLDVRRPEVDEFVFEFMPLSEWQLFDRNSVIDLHGQEVSHPLEANIWQFPEELQNEYLESIKAAGSNQNKPMPEKFIDWITWKLGDKIAEDYMIPYNMKMFADELDELGTYWLEKLPSVNYEETLMSCKAHHAYGTQPGHAQFYYPIKYGYGEVWLRMAEALGNKIECGMGVEELDVADRTVKLSDGSQIKADKIITTIPWNSINVEGLDSELTSGLHNLKHSSIETRYVPDTLDTKAQWIYVPDPRKPYHRILVRHNFLESKGYWLETRKERVGIYDSFDDSIKDNFAYMNEYAYPLNTIGKPEYVSRLLNACKAFNVFGLGRWGEHSHYNSDLVVSLAMKLSQNI